MLECRHLLLDPPRGPAEGAGLVLSADQVPTPHCRPPDRLRRGHLRLGQRNEPRRGRGGVTGVAGGPFLSLSTWAERGSDRVGDPVTGGGRCGI